MPISGSNDYNVNRTYLIRRAFRRLGHTSPSNDELANAADALNDIVKELDAEGRWLWAITNTESTLSLVASQSSYDVTTDSIASDILELETFAVFRGSNQYEYLTVINKTESLSTIHKEGTGTPLFVHLERHPTMSSQKIHVFPTPSQADTVKYTYRRRLYDFDSSSDNPDFPQEWIRSLSIMLAADLADDFGQPGVKQLLQADAERAKRLMLAANEESSKPSSVPTVYF